MLQPCSWWCVLLLAGSGVAQGLAEEPASAWLAQGEAAIRARVLQATAFTIDLPRMVPGRVIDPASFGFAESARPEVNAAALQQAFDHCRVAPGSEVRLAPGRYRIGRMDPTPGNAIDPGQKDSHHHGALYQLKLLDLEDVTLAGQGATLVFGEVVGLPRDKVKQGAYLIAKGCHRLLIKDLVFDWDESAAPLAFFATVSAIDQAAGTIDYRTDPEILPEGVEIIGMREWDPVRQRRDVAVGYFTMSELASQQRIDGRTLRFTMKNPRVLSRLSIGDGARFQVRTTYRPNGMVLDRNAQVTLQRVAMQAVPLNGVWARRTGGLQILDSSFAPRPGGRPVWSCHAALEIHNTPGMIRIEGCEFAYTNDDVLHLSDFFLPGNVTRVDDHTLQVGGLAYWQSGDTVLPGTRLEFRSPTWEPLGFSAGISAVSWTRNPGRAQHEVTITTQEALPKDLDPGTLLFNTTYGQGRFVVRRNTVRNCFNHGFYIGMPNGLIEDNELTSTGYPSILLFSTIRWERWPNGHPPHDVIIRNNRISDGNTARRAPAEIFIGGGRDPVTGPFEPAPHPLVEDVIVEDNRITGTTCQGLAAWSCQRVLIQRNHFSDTNQLPSAPGMRGSVFVKNAEHIAVQRNRWDASSTDGDSDRSLAIDADTTRGIHEDSNLGFPRPGGMPDAPR
jgi:hypothetical protein